VKATAEQMREFLKRDLTGLDLAAIFIDGIAFKWHLIVVAFGLDKGGRKHVLGLWQGATENAAVCTSLLEDIARRGLTTGKDYMVCSVTKHLPDAESNSSNWMMS